MRLTSRLVATAGVVTLLAGGMMLGTAVAATAPPGSTTTPGVTLSFSSTAAGVTCNNTNSALPNCTGLARNT